MQRRERKTIQSAEKRGSFNKESEENSMKIDETISKLDGACGRLLVAAMKDPVVREAMEMVTEVSIALGELGEEMEDK